MKISQVSNHSVCRTAGPVSSDSAAAPHQGGADRRAGAAPLPQEVHIGGARRLPHRRRTDAEQPQLLNQPSASETDTCGSQSNLSLYNLSPNLQRFIIGLLYSHPLFHAVFAVSRMVPRRALLQTATT